MLGLAALLLLLVAIPAGGPPAGQGPEAGTPRLSFTAAPLDAAGEGGTGGSGPAAGTRGRAWPVSPGGGSAGRPPVVRGWLPPSSPWGAGHRGVDLGTAAGRGVRAAAPGVVAFAGTVAGRGVVSVDLDGPDRPLLRTTYEPVRASVHEGERVRAGQVVGMVQAGPYHCLTACLHWGLRLGARYLDPLSLLPRWMLRTGGARLLPVTGVPLPAGDALAAHAAPPAARPGASGRNGRKRRSPAHGRVAGQVGVPSAAGALILAAGAICCRLRLGRSARAKGADPGGATGPGGPGRPPAGAPRTGPSRPRPGRSGPGPRRRPARSGALRRPPRLAGAWR